jgi:predicted transcriptional regulator of viral defense system
MTETIHLLKQLEDYPTFTVQTIESIIEKDPAYAKVYLNRLKKRQLVHQLQRNVYTVNTDPFIIASRIIWPSYISLWASLRYHNLTDQTPHTISVLTPRAKTKQRIAFKNTTIVFQRIKPRYFFGFSKTRINGFEVFIAEPEKALIDAVLLKQISISEIYSILKTNLRNLSMKKLIEYILRTQNGAVAKRFGWMLDSLGEPSVKKLEKLVYKTTIPLDYSRSNSGEKNQHWGIIVNIGGTS